MSPHDVLEVFEKLVSSGTAALAVVCVVAYYQTRELRACRQRDAECAHNLTRYRVALARVYDLVRERIGGADELPTLDELMGERRKATE